MCVYIYTVRATSLERNYFTCMEPCNVDQLWTLTCTFTTTHDTIHPSVRPCIQSYGRAGVRGSVRPCVRASERPSVRPSVRASVHPGVPASLRPCLRAHPRTHTQKLIHTFPTGTVNNVGIKMTGDQQHEQSSTSIAVTLICSRGSQPHQMDLGA